MAQLLRHLDTHNAYGDHIGKHLLRCHSSESLSPLKALSVVSLFISGNPLSFMVQKRVIKGRVSRVGYFNRCWIFWSLFPSFYSLLENQVQRFCLLLCSLLRDFEFENAYRKCRWPCKLPQKAAGRWELENTLRRSPLIRLFSNFCSRSVCGDRWRRKSKN